ncbi:beta/gamma crystallin family protein [Corallococcus exiguus]|uniref:beta/gamma crystallin-related protein n=1 Tax=Corallococcus exiguus TaxID=83462 RepID=UPI001A8F3860|nr:beta/gamma crystallin-related protein [Corallococcus exiguus]MBN8472984.1 beta/gamma crystallin family protein [Corallococcus exiguus]
MANPQITLYRDTKSKGRSIVLTCGSSSLGNDYDFNDQTSSIEVTSGVWLVYDDSNYNGAVYILPPGDYSSPGMWGGKGDAISSVRPLPGSLNDNMAVLFKDSNYAGRMVAITAPVPKLSAQEFEFNDQASSALILGGTWQLYKNSDYDGTPWVLSATGGPTRNGRYPSSDGFFGNDAVSSIKPE